MREHLSEVERDDAGSVWQPADDRFGYMRDIFGNTIDYPRMYAEGSILWVECAIHHQDRMVTNIIDGL